MFKSINAWTIDASKNFKELFEILKEAGFSAVELNVDAVGRGNHCLTMETTEEELKDALEIAQALSFVEEKGIDAPVEEGGANFSGGQRQRLTIARALVRKPAILILDDSASALDYATDAALRMAIRNMEHAPTTFIVSQRAASVRYADQIIVLDDGQLVGKGTHESLLESCSVYQEIYYSQFPKEVADNG